MTHLPWSRMTSAEKSAAIKAGVAAFMSATQMGALHRCSNNAIIGFARRNFIRMAGVSADDESLVQRKLHDRAVRRAWWHKRKTISPVSKAEPVPQPKQKPVPTPRPHKVPQLRVQAPPLVPAEIYRPGPMIGPVRFADRRNCQCSWPTSGQPSPNMLVCGDPVAVGCYCAAHFQRSRATTAGRHLLTLERGSEVA